MRTLWIRAVVVFVLWISAAPANAAIIVTFDDLTGEGLVPDGYGGIQWGSGWFHYDFSQPPYTPHSPPQRIGNFCTSNDCSYFSFVGASQVFEGAWFSGFGSLSNRSNKVHFELFRNSVLVATSGNLFPSATPAFLPSDYSGLVDMVHVVSDLGDYYTMDDVTYTTAVIPEPCTALLLCSGLAAVALKRCNRRGERPDTDTL